MTADFDAIWVALLLGLLFGLPAAWFIALDDRDKPCRRDREKGD